MMTPGSRYVQLLGGMPNSNNGTVTGGLGHVLQQFLMGSSMRKEQQDQEAAQGVFSRALEQMQGTPANTITWNGPRPDGTGEPVTNIPAVPGNFSAALQTLGSNPVTAEYGMGLQLDQLRYEQELAAQQAAAGNELVEVVRDGVKVLVPRSEVQPGEQSDYAPTPETTSAQRDAVALGLVPGSSEYNDYIRQRTLPAPPATGGGGAGGPFDGTSMDAQAMNILLGGDTSSSAYLAAYNYMAQPKMQYDQASGQMIQITPNMSAFRLPASMGAPVPDPNAAAADLTGTPAMGPTANIQTEQVGDGRLSDSQAMAAGYYEMMVGAEQDLVKLESAGTDLGDSLLSQDPTGLGNYGVSDDFQLLDQARRNFMMALLRKQSGATITADEMEQGNKQYFPVPGDSPEVIEQKRRNREMAIQSVLRAAGPNYTAPGSESAAPTAGDMVDGYIFMGGDPSVEANWQKAQ